MAKYRDMNGLHTARTYNDIKITLRNGITYSGTGWIKTVCADEEELEPYGIECDGQLEVLVWHHSNGRYNPVAVIERSQVASMAVKFN